MGLLGSLGTGVRDLFYEPANALVRPRGPAAVAPSPGHWGGGDGVGGGDLAKHTPFFAKRVKGLVWFLIFPPGKAIDARAAPHTGMGLGVPRPPC